MNRETTEHKIEEIEKVINRLKEEEVMEKVERMRKMEERKKREEAARNERMKQEEKRRIAAEKRLEKVEKGKKTWETMEWITGFIGENQERWEADKTQGKIETVRKLEEWDRLKRLEKNSQD